MSINIETKEILRAITELKAEQDKTNKLLDMFIPSEFCFSDLYNKHNVPKSTAMNFLKNHDPRKINKKGSKIYIDKVVAFEFIQRYSNV